MASWAYGFESQFLIQNYKVNSHLESKNKQMSAFGCVLIETLVESMRVGVQHGQIASLLPVLKPFCLKLHQCAIIVLNAKTCRGRTQTVG